MGNRLKFVTSDQILPLRAFDKASVPSLFSGKCPVKEIQSRKEASVLQKLSSQLGQRS